MNMCYELIIDDKRFFVMDNLLFGWCIQRSKEVNNTKRLNLIDFFSKKTNNAENITGYDPETVWKPIKSLDKGTLLAIKKKYNPHLPESFMSAVIKRLKKLNVRLKKNETVFPSIEIMTENPAHRELLFQEITIEIMLNMETINGRRIGRIHKAAVEIDGSDVIVYTEDFDPVHFKKLNNALDYILKIRGYYS